jgi:uncharacterized protein YbcI
MNDTITTIAEQLAQVASRIQAQRTGHAPKAVSVVLSEDTLVVTLLEALTPAERALARSAQGAAQVQEFHRRLFANSTEEMWQQIERITGRQVREATAEIETETGTVVHAFTTGAMVQVYLLASGVLPEGSANEQVERAEDDGLHITREAMQQAESSRQLLR